MNENEQPDPKGVSRRTVTKAMAWAVPVIAVAATVPGAVASPAPPPFFDFLNGSKNPGNSCTTTCIPKQSYGVPVTVTNPQATSLIIQFTDYLVNGSSVGINNVGVVYPGLNCATNECASCPLPAGCTVVDSIPISANPQQHLRARRRNAHVLGDVGGCRKQRVRQPRTFHGAGSTRPRAPSSHQGRRSPQPRRRTTSADDRCLPA